MFLKVLVLCLHVTLTFKKFICTLKHIFFKLYHITNLLRHAHILCSYFSNLFKIFSWLLYDLKNNKKKNRNIQQLKCPFSSNLIM